VKPLLHLVVFRGYRPNREDLRSGVEMEQAAHAPHRWLVRSIVGLATIVAIVAIFAVWADRQLLNTGGWTTTSEKLIESPPVREAVSGFLTEEIYANVNVAGELRSSLPSQLKPLAGPAAGALRTIVQKGVNLALERPLVQELWRGTNEVAHRQFVKLIENKGKVVKTPGGGTVVLDLRPLLTEAATRVGVSSSVVARIPPDVAEIQVVKSKNLQTMQTAVNVLRSLAIALPLIALLLYGLAVYLARGRRPHTMIVVGACLIFAGIVVLIARSLIGKVVVESLATTESVRPAASAAWSIATSILVDVAGAVIFVGVPVVLAGMLGGSSQPARKLRRSMAPYLRDRPGIAFGIVGLLLIILFAWGPIDATRNWVGILVIIALSMFGTEMLRREAVTEFPYAQAGPPGALGRGWQSISERFAAAGSSLSAEAHAARRRLRGDGTEPRANAGEGTPNANPGSTTAHEQTLPASTPSTGSGANAVSTPGADLAAQLQSLAGLHRSGALSDDEYAAAKRRLLGMPGDEV
jgi:hypothetical protein